MKKAKTWMSLAINYIFCGVVFIICLCTLFLNGSPYGIKPYCIRALPFGLILAVLLVFLYRHLPKKQLRKKAEIAVITSFMLILILTLVFLSRKLAVYASWDLGYIYSASTSLAENGTLSEGAVAYFSSYPFQLFLPTFFSVLLKILPFSSPGTALVIINIFFIASSFLLLYLLAKKLTKNTNKSLFVLFLACLCTPLMLYAPIYYSDTASMFFILLSFLLFLNLTSVISRPKPISLAKNASFIAKTTSVIISKKSQILLSIAFALSSFIAYEIKATSVILLIAIAITCLLKSHNKILPVVIFTAVFGTSALLWNSHVSSLVNTSDAFPKTHWLMMGQKENTAESMRYGGYSASSVDLTANAGDNTKDKTAADLQEIKNTLSARGPLKTLAFLGHKISYTWGDGTYFVSEKLCRNPLRKDTLFHQIFAADGEYNLYYRIFANSVQVALFAIFLLGGIKTRKSAANNFTILKLCVIGLFIFFLFWEARSRYLLNFLPLFVVLAASFLDFFAGDKASASAKAPASVKAPASDKTSAL